MQRPWSEQFEKHRKESSMPRFLIERNFAERLEDNKEVAGLVTKINDEEGVKWLFSFLSPDKRKTYCLYEAPSADAIRAAARKANIPADVVIQVEELRPEMFVEARAGFCLFCFATGPDRALWATS
jgi:hypothetical protein